MINRFFGVEYSVEVLKSELERNDESKNKAKYFIESLALESLFNEFKRELMKDEKQMREYSLYDIRIEFKTENTEIQKGKFFKKNHPVLIMKAQACGTVRKNKLFQEVY